MKNKITDLNNHLFAQLERLGEEGQSEEKLRLEIARAAAMVGIAGKIIDAGRLMVDARKVIDSEPQNGSRMKLLGLDE